MFGNRHSLLWAAAPILLTLLLPQAGLARDIEGTVTRTTTSSLSSSTMLNQRTYAASVYDFDPAQLLCQRIGTTNGVLRQPQILIRRLPGEFAAGSHHEFVFAGQYDNYGTGYRRKLENGTDQQSVSGDGLAFWAGGFNFTAYPENSGPPNTATANYSIAFVYDLPTTLCDSELFYTTTPALELPNGYTVNGKSTFIGYWANNHIVKKVDANGGFHQPSGWGYEAFPPGWQHLAAFDYVEWEEHSNGALLSEYQPVGSDPTLYLEDAPTSGSVVLEAGQTAQLVIEFELKVGGWCLDDCAPLKHIAPWASGTDLQDIDDLVERGHLSVTTLGPESANSESGILYWMGPK